MPKSPKWRLWACQSRQNGDLGHAILRLGHAKVAKMATLACQSHQNGDFGTPMSPKWRLWHAKVAKMPTLARRSRQNRITVGATLGPLWVCDGDFRSLWDHCGIIVESLWVYEDTFSKNTHFPNIKGMGEFGIDLGLHCDFFWHMRVTLDPFWGHFGITLGI